MWSTRYSCRILMKLEFYIQIFQNYSNIKFHENPYSGSQAVPCGRGCSCRHTTRLYRSPVAILRTRLTTQRTSTNYTNPNTLSVWTCEAPVHFYETTRRHIPDGRTHTHTSREFFLNQKTHFLAAAHTSCFKNQIHSMWNAIRSNVLNTSYQKKKLHWLGYKVMYILTSEHTVENWER